MKQFFEFIKSKKELRWNFILALIGLSLLPGRNHFYDLDLGEARPLVRTVNLSLPPLAEIPVNTTGVKAPGLSARSAVVIDVDSKTILYAKSPDLKLLPASTTKIMTAL